MTAVAYMRCSSMASLAGDTWERQITAIRQCCEAQGLELIREYREEAVPGKTSADNRPAFQLMISELLGNGCRTIVVEALDRLARSYSIQEQLITYIASKRLRLIAANSGEDITAAMIGDPMKRAMVQMQAVFAELDKNMLVAKLRKARDRKRAANGRCEGPLPYQNDEVLRIIKIHKAQGYTLAQVAEELNRLKIPAAQGGSWHAMTVQRLLKRASAAKLCNSHT